MKKVFTFLFITLMGISQVWGISKTQLTVNISGGGQIAVNTSPAKPSDWSSSSVTKDQGHGTFDVGVTDTYYIWVNPNNGYYCSGVSDCSWDNNGYYTISFKGSATTNKRTVTATFVGNSYTLTFDGNGKTSGSMSNQGFVYGTSKAITANAFKREFTITYDANEGTCETSSATATAQFSGWAKSATGSVVYTDKQSLSTPTPIPAHNSQINLYAIWTDASVTLPEVSRDGFLFDGWYDGETWVGKIGSQYTPTASTTLTAHWADKLTPVFSLDKTEIELDQVAVLTMDNVNNPSIEITPAGIVNYNAETGALTGVGVGEVTISATQEAVGNLSNKHEELTLNVTRKTPSLSVFLNGVEQSSIILFQGKKGTATFTKVSDAEVQVSAVSGGQCASYADGVISTGEIGTAKFRATLPQTDTYKSTYVEFTVETQKDPIHLPMSFTQAMWNSSEIKVATSGTNSWDGDNQIRIGHGTSGGANWDDKWVTIHFVGIPDKLNFEYKYDYVTEGTKNSATGWGQSEDPNQLYYLYVDESSDNSNWTPLVWQSTDPFKDNWKQSGALQLKKTTRYIRFHLHANLGAYYRNIQISELKYVQDPDPASIDFGSAIIYTGEVSADIDVNWCNIAPMKVESSNPKFTVTPSTFANYDQYGSQKIKIAYNHTDEVGDFSGNITISNGTAAYTKTIPVHAETTKRIQTITWNADLVATGYAMNVGESYPDEVISVIATTQSGGAITYSSGDETVIEVVDGTKLVAKAVGTVEITAYQAGDNEYAEVSDKKTFTVTALQKQSITWDQNLYGLLTTSSPVELTATATSGMAITYTSANENVVRIDGNTLIVVGEGETYVTATQAGGVDENEVEWFPISLNNYVIVRNPASQCKGMALSQSSLTLGSSKTSQEYTLSGIPAMLTFTAKHGEKSGQWGAGTSYAALVVEQYAYLNGLWDWYVVYNKVVGTNDTQSGNITIDESAKKIRFATGETGVDHTISNIVVTRSKFLRADVTSIDEEAETNATWTKTITVSHSNIDLMSLSTQNGLLTLSANTLGEGCGDYGDDAFTVSFTPSERDQEYNDVIVISDGKAQPTTINIPVHLQSRGLKQYLSGFDLQGSCLTTETVTMPSVTATSGLNVIFLSSDSTIAYVENNALKILSAGKVTIYAYQGGDDRWGEVSQGKEITINLTPIEILEAPTAKNVEDGQSLSASELIGGSASVEGSFAWVAPETVPAFGTNTYSVIFTPTLNTIYGTATTTVEVTVVPPTTYGAFEATFCQGGSETFNGKVYTETTKEDVKLEVKNIYGGDSIVKVNITVHPTYLIQEEETAYIGEEYTWQGKVRPTDATGKYDYKETYTTVNGCDSIYTLVLNVAERITTYGVFETKLCEGDSIFYAGLWYYDEEDQKVLKLDEKNIYGGDSIVTLTIVLVKPSFTKESMEMTYGEDKSWNGIALSDSTVGTHILTYETKNIDGCDSTVTLTLTVEKQEALELEKYLTFCPNGQAEYAGKIYTEAGTDKVIFPGEIRDTIVNVTITELKAYNIEEKDTVYVGETYIWQGEARATDEIGTTPYSKEFATVDGCDSIYTLELTVIDRPTTYGTHEEKLCQGDSVYYAGKWWYDEEDQKVLKLDKKNIYGGDSIVTLTIVVVKPSFAQEEMEMVYGEDKSWNGIALNDSTVGTHIVTYQTTNAGGCDSTVTLTLTVKKQAMLELSKDIAFCAGDSAEYKGKWYTAAGKDVLNFPGDIRDTTITVNVTVHQPSYALDELEMVYGTDTTWNGIALSDSTAGLHIVTYQTKNIDGCDSIVTLTLIVNKQAPLELSKDLEFCEGDSVEYLGKWYYAAGKSNRTLPGDIRDTTITVNVTVHALSYSQEEMTIVIETDTTWNGIALGDSIVGTHYVTYVTTNAAGCDSIVTLTLTVEPKPADPETPTGLDQMQTEVRATKVYRNGVIYIRRGEMLYGLDGKRIE